MATTVVLAPIAEAISGSAAMATPSLPNSVYLRTNSKSAANRLATAIARSCCPVRTAPAMWTLMSFRIGGKARDVGPQT